MLTAVITKLEEQASAWFKTVWIQQYIRNVLELEKVESRDEQLLQHSETTEFMTRNLILL